MPEMVKVAARAGQIGCVTDCCAVAASRRGWLDAYPLRAPRLERRRTDDLPAVAAPHFVGFRSIDRPGPPPQSFLKKPRRPRPGIEERHGAGFGVSVFPGMRHAAWHEGAGARPTDRELVADLEGDFAAQHVGRLVTVVVKVDVVSVPAGPVSSNSMTLLPVSSPTAPPPSLIYKAHVRIPGARCGNLQTREGLGRPNADASSN